MADVRVTLSGLWIALMLTYLLGDVLRIMSGDASGFMTNGFNGTPVNRWMWLGMATLMLVPILMLVFSLVLPHPAIRWVTLVAAAFLFVLNAVGLPTYPGLYDKFLIAVGLVFNGVTFWYAWTWH
jgi:hypothetical protein